MNKFRNTRAHQVVGYIATLFLLSACQSGGNSTSQVNTTEVGAVDNELIVSQEALAWEQCEDDVLLECADLQVPMDYSNPTGQTITVGLARIPVSGDTIERTMLLNPGGPGGGGQSFLGVLRRFADVPLSLRRTTRFVSFDPRGIGRSTPVSCNENLLSPLDAYPISDTEVQSNLEIMSDYAASCSEDNGEYLQHLGSFNVVRDMNEMRKAMELDQIDFLGFSYGTRLGALFLQTYPQQSGRFVLDGSMTPDPSLTPLAKGSLITSQVNINRMIAACINADVNCNVNTFSDELLEQVELVGSQPNSLESALLFAILRLASTQPGFENLIIGRLAEYVATGDVGELIILGELFGFFEDNIEDESSFNQAVFTSVMCADDAARPTVATVQNIRPSFNADSDLMAETQYNVVTLCSGWPTSVDPIPAISTNQAPASLVIGGPTDAQTPLIFAEQMASALGGQFLRSEHDGHTTVFSGQNNCTETAVEEFLLNGTLPTTAVCERNIAADSFADHWMPTYQQTFQLRQLRQLRQLPQLRSLDQIQ